MNLNILASLMLALTLLAGLTSFAEQGRLDYTTSHGVGNFVIHGTASYRYQIQESFNLTSWHSLGDTFTASSPKMTISLLAGTNAYAFYRFQEFPPNRVIFTTLFLK